MSHSRSRRGGSAKRIAMSEPVWNQYLTERDKPVFTAGGFGPTQGCGKRPK